MLSPDAWVRLCQVVGRWPPSSSCLGSSGLLDSSAWILDVLGLVDGLIVAFLGWVVVSPWLVVIHWFEAWFSFSRFMDGLAESVGFSGRHEELGVDLALGTEGSRVLLHDLLSMLLGLSSSKILFSIVLVSLVARPALLDCGVGTASGLASFDGLSREVSRVALDIVGTLAPVVGLVVVILEVRVLRVFDFRPVERWFECSIVLAASLWLSVLSELELAWLVIHVLCSQSTHLDICSSRTVSHPASPSSLDSWRSWLIGSKVKHSEYPHFKDYNDKT